METTDFTTESVDDQSTNGHSEQPDFSAIFDAPDWSSWLKRTKTGQSKEYELKANSFFKLLMNGAINSGQWADAATIIDRGPTLAAAIGDFAEANETFRHLIDVGMAPDSPTARFVMTSIPFVSQLWRNHEPQVQQVAENVKRTRAERRAAKKTAKESGIDAPKMMVEKKILGRTFVLPIRFVNKFKLKNLLKVPAKFFVGFRATTEDPVKLAYKVFTNDRVIKELRKQGIYIPGEDRSQENA